MSLQKEREEEEEEEEEEGNIFVLREGSSTDGCFEEGRDENGRRKGRGEGEKCGYYDRLLKAYENRPMKEALRVT